MFWRNVRITIRHFLMNAEESRQYTSFSETANERNFAFIRLSNFDLAINFIFQDLLVCVFAVGPNSIWSTGATRIYRLL